MIVLAWIVASQTDNSLAIRATPKTFGVALLVLIRNTMLPNLFYGGMGRILIERQKKEGGQHRMYFFPTFAISPY